jgi:hypothetical protein
MQTSSHTSSFSSFASATGHTSSCSCSASAAPAAKDLDAFSSLVREKKIWTIFFL